MLAKKWFNALITIFLPIIFYSFSGCVTTLADSGRDFDSSLRDKIIIGSTSRKDIANYFGSPESKNNAVVAGKSHDEITYMCWRNEGSVLAAEPDVADLHLKHLSIEFIDSTVNGFSFTSSFIKDSITVDFQVAKSIIPNETKEDEVIKLLGKPQGRYLLPSFYAPPVKLIPDGITYGFLFQTMSYDKETNKPKFRTMTILFDQKGIVGKILTKFE
jgi:hypothetical protein